MSATPCLVFQVPEWGSRCRACGGSREEHEGRAPLRLPYRWTLPRVLVVVVGVLAVVVAWRHP